MKFLGIGYFFLYSTFIGGVTGFLTWAFLALLSITTHLLWIGLPSVIDVRNWTIILCLTGGVLVGLCQKYFGNYPRRMDEVLGELKKTKRIDYSSGFKNAISAIIVLSFGASLGPEAALVGIIGGLSTWAGDAIKSIVKKKPVLSEHGDIIIEYSVEASVGMIFRAPLYGAFTLFEDRGDPRRRKLIKTLVYTITTAAGFSVFFLLSQIDNRSFSLADFGPAMIGLNEMIAIIPLILVGILFAKLYGYFGYLLPKMLKPLENYKVIKAMIGGVVLGLIGTVLPIILFSGEHELTELASTWMDMSFYLLLGMGIVKLFLTEFCLASGWRGGHIFPLIFAGVSIGYAVALLFPVDPVTSVAVVTTALTSAVLQKPIAVILLFVLIFPLKLIILIIVAAYLPVYIKKLNRKSTQKRAH
ncbi:chloride channel protein [Paenibacillus faecalis]|uniref:chloride channel protein n=1 Tax=Paenibacillus faecalis TaxID=2079532 RepID=UPI000D103A29|nr:chloride channel protein [Paenibacillus faecalis]